MTGVSLLGERNRALLVLRRLLLGWHPDSPAAGTAERVLAHALAAYREAVDRHPGYRDWLVDNPGLGVQCEPVS